MWKRIIAILAGAVLCLSLVGCSSVPEDLKDASPITSEEFWTILEYLDYDIEEYGTTRYEDTEQNTARLNYTGYMSLENIEYVRCVDNAEAEKFFEDCIKALEDSAVGTIYKHRYGSRASWKTDLDGSFCCYLYQIDNTVILVYFYDPNGAGEDNAVTLLTYLLKLNDVVL